ncbi:MAG: hypothetical protein K0B14_05810 [Anaerolineaceae bacterium]|nr:hypothetical protein [Anaerolineaceae bacterium]
MQKGTFISILLLFMFLFLLIIVNLPSPRLVSEIKITNEASNQYLLISNLPERIWFGQSEKIHIQLLHDNSQSGLMIKKTEQSNFDSRKIQNLEVDFVMTGAELTPLGISITPMIEGKDIMMNWAIKPTTDQDVIGTVWIYINTFPDGDDKENIRELIFTRNLSINIKTVRGLSVSTIKWILSIFFFFNIIYLFRSFRKIKVFNGIQK